MRENAQRLLAILLAHHPAELILVEFSNRARQQRMVGFAFERFFGVTRHIEPNRASGTQHQIDPVQRHIGGEQRIAFAGQRQGFLFIHRHDADMLAQEIAPELRIVANHMFGAQRQHHRHVVAFGILNRP